MRYYYQCGALVFLHNDQPLHLSLQAGPAQVTLNIATLALSLLPHYTLYYTSKLQPLIWCNKVQWPALAPERH